MRKRIRLFLKRIGLVLAGALGLYVLACSVGGSSLSDIFLFLYRFIDTPASVGAVAPSSQLLAQALVAKVQPGTANEGKIFLEIGPGTGVVTREFIAVLGPKDRLDVVELDSHLARSLKERYAGNSQVVIFEGSILEWPLGEAHRYDAIVMGIPFNALPLLLVQDIWRHVQQLAKPEAIVSYFSYIGLPHIKKALLTDKEERRDFKAIQRYLRKLYKKQGVGKKKIWANVPPAKVSYLRFNGPFVKA